MAGSHEPLASILEVLASPVRLQILSQLRRPTAVLDLKVNAARHRRGEREGRLLSRQTLGHHLAALEKAGLVRRVDGEAFVLDHARLFASVDELRQLSKIRAVAVEEVTRATPPEPEPNLPSGPRLMVAYGRDDGVAFPLPDVVGSECSIGRDPECDVCLDYDPFASGINTRIEKTRDGFRVHDVDSRNGTRVDWQTLPPGGSRALRPGALIGIGRTILVFQD